MYNKSANAKKNVTIIFDGINSDRDTINVGDSIASPVSGISSSSYLEVNQRAKSLVAKDFIHDRNDQDEIPRLDLTQFI